MDGQEKKCNKCKSSANENTLTCAGNCGNNYHQKCTSISSKDFSIIQNCRGLKWFCDNCLQHFDLLINFNAEINKLRTEINSELSGIHNIINKHFNNKCNENNIESNKTSYADVAAGEVVIVKPKNKQESKKTKEAIQKNLKPTALEVGITQLKDIKEGGVVIKCKTKEEQDKIKKAAEKKLTKNYQITAPVLKNPCIKIVDIEEHYEKDDLINCIKKQNSNIQHDTFKMEVKVFKKMRTRYMAIVECDPASFKKILDEKYLYINWSRCRAFEYVGVFRCFKCGGFNHHADKCTKEEKCLKCSESGHKTEECESDVVKCANCLEIKSKSNLEIDVHHFIFDTTCPVYLKKIEIEKQKIKQVSNE